MDTHHTVVAGILDGRLGAAPSPLTAGALCDDDKLLKKAVQKFDLLFSIQ